jgi:5'-3' exonuclease
MGIKDFYKHLKTKFPECFVPVDYSSYAYQRIALDMMNLLYVYKARDERNWLKRVIEFILYLRSLKVHPVCVFDGQSHPLKQATVEKRRTDREKGKIRVDTLVQSVERYKETREIDSLLEQFLSAHPEFMSKLTGKPILAQMDHYIQRQYKNYNLHIRTTEVETLKQVLKAIGVVVLTAEYDGEALCSWLSALGKVELVVSNDSDVFFFGCQKALFKFTEQGGYQICFPDILKYLDIDQQAFVDLCLLCGTDFNTSVKGIGFCRALALIQRYKSIHHPEFPIRDQLDLDNLDFIRQMARPSDCANTQIIEYCQPLCVPDLERLVFVHQLGNMDISKFVDVYSHVELEEI